MANSSTEKKQQQLYDEYSLLFNEHLFSYMDRSFADFVLSFEEEYRRDYHLLLLALAFSAAHSHVCYRQDFPLFESTLEEHDDEEFKVKLNAFLQELRLVDHDAVVHCCSTVCDLAKQRELKPVLYYNGAFYLEKYFRYEQVIAERIKELDGGYEDVDRALLKSGADLLFGTPDNGLTDWQKVAAIHACLRKLTIISGGPGTGKTRTLSRLLLLKAEQYYHAGEEFLPLLLAPTGKAASRIQESISRSFEELKADTVVLERFKEIFTTIKNEAYTVHRMIYSHSERDKPLYYNTIIIDESSMLDTALLYKLFSICSTDVSLVLLGDKNQLASVQAGSVFSDLCSFEIDSPYSMSIAAQLSEITTSVDVAGGDLFVDSPRDSLVFLRKSYRFKDDQGIGLAAKAVMSGDSDAFFASLACEADLSFFEYKQGDDEEDYYKILRKAIKQMSSYGIDYGDYLDAETVQGAITDFSSYTFLCCVNDGIYGVTKTNELIERYLQEHRNLFAGRNLYHNMPVLITKNNYLLNVYNGDIGLLRRSDEGLMLYLDDYEQGRERYISPALLQDFQKVYAMTVHKSQGTEYDIVVIVVPERPYPFITRELIYTALTRAKKHAVIVGSKDAVAQAVSRQTNRMSSLQYMLRQ